MQNLIELLLVMIFLFLRYQLVESVFMRELWPS